MSRTGRRWLTLFVVFSGLLLLAGCGGLSTGEQSTSKADVSVDSAGGQPDTAQADVIQPDLSRPDLAVADTATEDLSVLPDLKADLQTEDTDSGDVQGSDVQPDQSNDDLLADSALDPDLGGDLAVDTAADTTTTDTGDPDQGGNLDTNDGFDVDDGHDAVDLDDGYDAVDLDDGHDAVDLDDGHDAVQPDDGHDAVQPDDGGDGMDANDGRDTVNLDDGRDAMDLDDGHDAVDLDHGFDASVGPDAPDGDTSDVVLTVPELVANNLLITEITIDPQNEVSSADNCEWFEIYNNTDSDIDLNRLTISDDDALSGQITESAIIPARTHATLGRRTLAIWQSACPALLDAVKPLAFYGTNPGFSNSKGEPLTISWNGGTTPVVIDSIPNLGGSKDCWSLDKDSYADNDTEANWCQCSNPFLDVNGTIDYGTPGDRAACPP